MVDYQRESASRSTAMSEDEEALHLLEMVMARIRDREFRRWVLEGIDRNGW